MVRLLQARGIRDERVLSAMNNVPRHLFVQKALAVQAYEDTPLPIGFGQSISQPYIVALMSSLLKLKPGLRVLEIGTGSGYQAAVLAQLGCTVFTVECVPELYRETGNLLHSLGFRSIYAFFGDGTLGLPDAAPFDRIIITACGPKIPAPLVEQLDKNGILIAPVGSREHQRLTCLHKSGDHPVAREHDAVIFVDLVGIHGRGTDQRAKSLPSEVGRVFL
ncbi:MAG: protein-L-isoaspartate(D-aspartate) O-methyltransferase [Desulfovibrio sp.]|jgi:protein-L-isoaspartate(D-aspartate) O-methyltransferase|nr:protein-L-isoaspartate(D-aspartate) O-methyltransferase [Desulfovibrio sp.]